MSGARAASRYRAGRPARDDVTVADKRTADGRRRDTAARRGAERSGAAGLSSAAEQQEESRLTTRKTNYCLAASGAGEDLLRWTLEGQT